MARYVNGLTGKKYAKITNDNERYIDMGIAEEQAVAMISGMVKTRLQLSM